MSKPRQVKMSGLLAAGIIPTVQGPSPAKQFGVPEVDPVDSDGQASGTPADAATDQDAGRSSSAALSKADLSTPQPQESAEAGIIPVGGVRKKIPLALIVDSPYQPRLKYDPEEIDRLAETMDTAEHADPIRVRLVNGKYELIGGHRRTRAARTLGWEEIDALVEEMSDTEAQAKTMLLAMGSVGLADYELATMFRNALSSGLCKTQRDVASYFGVNASKVNGCLDLLKLPRSIVLFLDARPDLFGYQTGVVIKKLCTDHPEHLAEIERGVQRLTEGATQNSLKSWVLQAIQGKSGREATKSNLITRDRRLIFTTKVDRDKRAITVDCKVPDVDMSEFEKALQAWLEEQAGKVAVAPADSESAADEGKSK